MRKIILGLIVVASFGVASCSSEPKEVKSPCVGIEGSPCERHRPVNNVVQAARRVPRLSTKPINNVVKAYKSKSLLSLIAAVVFAVIYYYPQFQSVGHVKYSDDKTIVGEAIAHDGDTIKMGEETVRLEYIDAPELKQTCKLQSENWDCGTAAKEKLHELITGKEVTCHKEGRDKYGRFPGRCFIGEVDVNRWMVANGWAVAYVETSKKYFPDEVIAKSKKLGIWQSKFTRPELWRKEKRNQSFRYIIQIGTNLFKTWWR